MGLTTVPDTDDPRVSMSPTTVVINVFYSLTPCMVVFASLCYLLWLILDERNAGMLQGNQLRRKLAIAQLPLKYTLLSVLLVVLSALQKHVVTLLAPSCSWVQRPKGSCLLSSGMPDEWSFWSAGLMTSMSIDSFLRWSVPFLTEDGSQHQCYTKREMDSLGYSSIQAQDMVMTLLLLAFVLGPVPLSRLVVQDATYLQMILGTLEGLLVGALFHVWRVKALDSDRERRVQDFLMHCMVRGGHIDRLRQTEVGKVMSNPEQHWYEKLKELIWDVCPRVWKDAAAKTRHDLENPEGREQPLLEASESIAESERMRRARENRQRKFWELRPTTVPGFEFLSTKVEDFVGIMKKQEEALKKEQEEALASMTAAHNQQQREQEEKMAKQAAELETQREEALARMKEEHRQKQLEQEAELKRQQDEALKDMEEAHRQQQLEQQRNLEKQAADLKSKLDEDLRRAEEAHRQQQLEQQEKMKTQEAELKRQQEEALRSLEETSKQQQLEQQQKLMDESREKLQKLQSEADEEIRRKREEMQRQKATFKEYQEKLDNTADVLQRLQTAIDEGDVAKLGEGLREEAIKPYLQDDDQPQPGQGGDDSKIKTLFKPVAHQAMSTYGAWMAAREKFKAELQNAEAYIEKRKGDGAALEDQVLDGKGVRSLFNSLVACVERGIALNKAEEDRRSCTRVEELLHAYAEREFTFCGNERAGNVHKEIISKAVDAQTSERLGSFDATDLATCLQTVDRKEEKFRKLALVQVGRVFEVTKDREGRRRTRPVSALTGCLQQLSTLIFFLDYIGKEDLVKTYRMFGERLDGFKAVSEAEEAFKGKIKGWIAEAREGYQGDETLLQKEDLALLEKEDTDVNVIITKMEQRQLPGMDVFKDIFCKLARVWEKDFGVLVVPHHTQVVALLVFKAFLNGDDAGLKTLIGQVSTGEGKSMLIASLALFVVSQTDKARRRRVHVVGTDEKLVQRDFESFRGVFESWRQEHLADLPPEEAKSFAVVCAKKAGGSPDVRRTIPDEAWIVYCEAKHVSSYYTQKARDGRLDARLYEERVLIIDEVDALIVDKDPTEEFVYDISERTITTMAGKTTIKRYTKDVVMALKGGGSTDGLLPSDATSTALFRDVSKLVKQVKEWKRCPNGRYKDEFGNWYGTDKQGRVNKDYKSNFLEVLRLADKKQPEMCWYERLYVMSVPRVFKLYSRIIGFSGTVGNQMEQDFLAQAYGAHFFVVPPFLQTCKQLDDKGKEVELYCVAEWAPRPTWNQVLGGPALVCGGEEEQIEKVAGLAFEARKKVPVLVIAKEDGQVKKLQEKMEGLARNQKLIADDVVRPLSASLFSQDPKQYKENLRLSTRFYSSHGEDKQWRITITDPSGARGTDYRMDDAKADELGGLLLIIMEVPLSERDWIQYKGRTARQKWKGQYCVILNAQDYRNERAIDQGILDALQSSPSNATSDALIKAISDKGLEKSKTDLESIQAVYNAGFVANEVCEAVWAKHKQASAVGVDVDLDEDKRNSFVKLCKMYRFWSYDEITREAGLISAEDFPKGFKSGVPCRDYMPEVLPTPPKMVLFMYDVSFSMKTPVGATTRMGACKTQLESMMRDTSIIGEHDQVGVAAFGYGLKYLLEPQADVRSQLDALMQGPLGDVESGKGEVRCQQERADRLAIKHPSDPGDWGLGKSTYFFFSMESLLQDLLQKGGELPKGSLWLIALTDGAPSDAQQSEAAAQARLKEYCEASNNVIIITVSDEVNKESKARFQRLVTTVQQGGGNGILISAEDVTDDSAIRTAFSNVKAALVDVGGTAEED